MILQHVCEQHASKNTVMHALYACYFLGMRRAVIARVFHKSRTTISNWIDRYETTRDFERKKGALRRGCTVEQQAWVVNYYENHPVSFLDEAKRAFELHYKTPISVSTIWRIIHQHGFTWKVLERRAMQVKESDVQRFFHELTTIDWTHDNLVFLDEVSFDSRGMLRKRGYALRGKTLCIRGEFERKPRISLLTFIDVDGVVNVFDTTGTFDRHEFVKCCAQHAASKSVRPYPGRGSIWILDGASIHCHPEIVYYLRSVGIVPIFLPAYCPFYNPIEYVFGLVKRTFKRLYVENKTPNLLLFVLGVMKRFEKYNLRAIYRHCGYGVTGRFDPGRRLDDISKATDRDDNQLLGFSACDEDEPA